VPWVYRFESKALKDLKKLDRAVASRIIDFLENRVMCLDDPRTLAKPLLGNMSGLWRFRVGDYRIVCQIKERELIVLVIFVGDRRDIYKEK